MTTSNQKLAAEAGAFQKPARNHLQSIPGAGSAVVSLGCSASPEVQRALLVAVDALMDAVVEALISKPRDHR